MGLLGRLFGSETLEVVGFVRSVHRSYRYGDNKDLVYEIEGPYGKHTVIDFHAGEHWRESTEFKVGDFIRVRMKKKTVEFYNNGYCSVYETVKVPDAAGGFRLDSRRKTAHPVKDAVILQRD